MEVVKRLEGSEPEKVNYDFEEHYLEENKEENNKRKKGTLFTMLGLILIAVLGYFGFKSFSTSNTIPIEKQHIATNSIETKTEITAVETTTKVKESIPTPEIIKKIEVRKKEKLEKVQVTQPVIYTEVLAKEMKPKVLEKVAIAPKEQISKKKESPSLTQIAIAKEAIQVIKIVEPKKEIIKPIIKKKPTIDFNSRKTRMTKVKRGDTLAVLSKRFYGTSQEFERIIHANKSIKSAKTPLKIGQKIIIPSIYKKYTKQKVATKKPNKAKVAKVKMRKVKIKRGDTLASIAQKFYGKASNFKRIIHANKNIKSSKTKLKAGQIILVPYLPKNQRRRFVTVKKGYSLAYISKKFYGTTKEIERIVRANRNIKSKKSTLSIGQKVYVPK